MSISQEDSHWSSVTNGETLMEVIWWLNLFQTGFSSVLEQNSSSSVFGVQSSLGNKRKWVSLPLEEASRDDGDKTPGGGPEPTSDPPDPMSPNHTLHNNRAHDSSRSKWPSSSLFSVHTSVSASSLAVSLRFVLICFHLSVQSLQAVSSY